MTAGVVTRCDADARVALAALFEPYGLTLALVADAQPIPGSYWGAPEAGLVGATLYVRADTPLHSAFHEACHFVCMPAARRHALDTNAGGDYDEENGVCFLQILLADKMANFSAALMCTDMDLWGYTFRLGSAQRWFDEDAADARAWLEHHGVIAAGAPTGRLREAGA